MAPVYSKHKCECTKRISEEFVKNVLTSTQNYKPRGNLDEASRTKYYQMLDNFMINCGKIPSIIDHEDAKDFENLMHLIVVKKSSDKAIEGDFIIVHLIYQGAKWEKVGRKVIPQYFEAYFQVNPKDMKQIFEALETARTAIKLSDGQKPRISKNGNVVCPLCESRKTRNEGLFYHLNLHLQIARFRCQGTDVNGRVCRKRFNQSSHFKTHLDKKHAGLDIVENEKVEAGITYEKVIKFAIDRLNIHNAIIAIDHIDYLDKKRDYEIDTQIMTELRKIDVEQNCQSQYCHFFPKGSNQTKETVKVEKPTAIAVDVASSNAFPSPQISTDHYFWITSNGVINNQDYALFLNLLDNAKFGGVSRRKLMEQTETSPSQTSFVNSKTKNQGINSLTKKQGVKRNKQVTYSMNKKVQISSDKENTSPIVHHVLPTDFHSKARPKHSLVHQERKPYKYDNSKKSCVLTHVKFVHEGNKGEYFNPYLK